MDYNKIITENINFELKNEDLCQLVIDKSFQNTERPIGVYSEVQSGKTSAIVSMAAKGLSLESVNTIVVVSMNLKASHSGNKESFDEAFNRKAPNLTVLDEKDLKRDLSIETLQNDKVIMVKKHISNLEKLKEFLMKYQHYFGERIIIFEDESDFQSVSYKTKKLQRIGNELLNIRRIFSECQYIQVTATPYSNLMQYTREFSPWLTIGLEKSELHKGLEEFFVEPNETMKAIRESRICKGEYLRWKGNPTINLLEEFPTFSEAIVSFAMASMILKKEKNSKYCMIINIHKDTAEHTKQKFITMQIIESIIRDYWSVEIQNIISLCYESFQKSSANTVMLSKENIVNDLREFIKNSLQVECLNVKNKGLIGEKDRLKFLSSATIIIGSNMLNRSIVFPNLLGFYYAKTVKTFVMDNHQQEFRFFGYREERQLQFMRIYATDYINQGWTNLAKKALEFKEDFYNKVYSDDEIGLPNRPRMEGRNLIPTSSTKINNPIVKTTEYRDVNPKNITVSRPTLAGSKKQLKGFLSEYSVKKILFNNLEREYYEIPLLEMKSYINKILLEMEFDNKYDSTRKILEIFDKARIAGTDSIKVIAKFDRDKSKYRGNGVTVNDSFNKAGTISSDEKFARFLSDGEEVVVSLIHQRGRVEKKWDGNEFIWPNLTVPSKVSSMTLIK